MLTGFLCALGAGLMWGIVFVTPLILGDYPGVVLSFGRYVGFGLIALVPAWFDRRQIAALSKADWRAALKLSLVGNILYYAALASAIQLADAPLPAMLIGTLPVIISICSNWAPGHSSESIAWRRLAPSLVIILAGLMLVNASELGRLDGRRSLADYALGCLAALAALAAWTWYPIMNARHMKRHPHIRSSTWSTAQGLATLPLALLGFIGFGAYTAAGQGNYAFPLGPRPALFVAMMLLLGLCASWLGTMLWNKASQRLPTSLAGQLIVFETLSALLYAFIWRGVVPSASVMAGVVLLCAGVAMGVGAFHRAQRKEALAGGT
ncbi:DMT family transporter [Noviherbaspirillum autotrophicum]|uniref:Membrane protein n=1 Tax=Noviherbaspirillum autotrophicum TaxID=709839 RepID=A0A0C2BYF2_9BURK|nr:DMT family transporter [Noviherbaspirillum autotrophicum]KIF83066.1 membrane protein [Noviherbaspirillum autotrophicum]